MPRTPRHSRSFRLLTVESLESRRLFAADLRFPAAAQFYNNQEIAPQSLELCISPAIGTIPASAGVVTSVAAAGLAAATYPLGSIPVLNSLSGAAATLFLDFDGHFDAVWGAYRNTSTPAFDTDGDPASFSDAELTAIRQIWQSVAEDYAPFNINVTTVQPPSFADRVAQRVAIGGAGSWLPGGRAGGVSYVDSFTNPSLVNTSYVFPQNLAGGYWKFVAEAASHEAGHGFGLEHISLYGAGGGKIDEYYAGPGDGRAPIMGDSYDAARGVWWAGSSSSLYTFQDDMNTLARPANGFGYRPDEHGNTIASATPLGAVANAVASAGVIMIMADVDYFRFTTGAGQVSFLATVPIGFNNLDTRLELRDAAGTLITSAAPSNSFNSSINAALNAGTYYIVVASQGSYGDIGQYTLTGTIVAGASGAVVAPTNLAATRGPGYQVGLSWTDSAANETGYVVERRSDIATAWAVAATLSANAQSFVDTNVVAGRVYEYQVKAVSGASNSAYSNVAGTAFAPTEPGTLSAIAASGGQVNLAWGNVSGELGYKIERLAPGGTWVQIATVGAETVSYQDAGLQAATTYQYRVRAYNYGGDSPYGNIVSVTTLSTAAQPPAAPFSLSAAAVSATRVNLHWYDNSNNETAFLIERSSDGVNWITVGQVASNVTSVADFSTQRRTTYYYRVFAVNAAGFSPPTNVVSIRTPLR
jgi:hypothetical protein